MIAALLSGGCASYTDQGALTGGALGLGTGALVGHAMGNTAAGALIGTGVGALGGAAVGSAMDESEARNRALIEQRLGHQVAPGAVSIQDVVAMTRAGIDETVIVTHIRSHGLAAPLQTADLIYLQQQGVSRGVVEAMQTQPVATVQPVAVPAYPPPVMVDGGPYYYDCYGRPYYYRPEPAVGLGVSFRGR